MPGVDQATLAEDVRRTLECLDEAMRLLKLSQRELERRVGWTNGTLSRIFNGKTALQYGHVLALLQVLELSPGRFFEIAYKPNSTRRDHISELFEEIEGTPVAHVSIRDLSIHEIETSLASLVEEAAGELKATSSLDPFAGLVGELRRRPTKPRVRLRPVRPSS